MSNIMTLDDESKRQAETLTAIKAGKYVPTPSELKFIRLRFARTPLCVEMLLNRLLG